MTGAGTDADAARALLERLRDDARAERRWDDDLADAGALLAAEPDLPAALHADLAVARGALLARAGRSEEALAALTAATDRFGADADPEVSRVVAFAWLTRVNVLVSLERLDAAADAARALMARLVAHADAPEAAGLGTMGLDAALWLLTAGADADALEVCMTLITTLGGRDDAAAQAVVAGARFFAAQATAHLQRMAESREQIEALCEMGEPALAALDRIATQFGGQGANPTWHAQIAATSVTVLWRQARCEEATALAREAAGSFARLGMPELAAMLSELEREIAEAG